ncbi:MAG: S41 family peptidase [Acidobacteriota bacterium]|nr:S41 family peptidase [Acidobacteriota bacterium]
MVNSRKDSTATANWLGVLTLLVVISFPVRPLASTPFVSVVHADSTTVSTDTREGRLAVFDDAWSTINQRYYDRTFRGLDWELQKTTFRALAAETNSGQELYAVLRRMIGTLHDPHTRVFAPEEKFDWWRPRSVTTGMAVREIDGLPTVVHVENGSAPQRAGVRVGDEIEAIDGEPALSAIGKRLGNSIPVSASSRFRAFASLMDGPAATSVEVRWKGRDGKSRTARFERYWQQRELGLRYRKEKGKIAVIEIDAFTKPIAASFAGVLREKLAGVRGIILDLRGNGGGEAEAMADVASALLGSGYDLGQFTDRAGASFEISTRAQSLLTPWRIEPTKLPLLVLASQRTSSAAEILVAALRSSRRAKIVGAETCGCVLAIRTRHALPDGGLLDVSELDYQTAQGERLEQRGIKPDETVLIQRSDLYSHRDRTMEFALRQFELTRSQLPN